MRGMFVIARYSMLELIRGRMFLIIVILALGVNFLMSWGWYKIAVKYDVGHELAINEPFPHSFGDENNPFSEDFDLTKVDVPLMLVKNAMRWFVYIGFIFFGNFLAVFGALGLVGPELDKRSIYTLISKPISRGHIFFGKLLGLFGVLLIYTLIINIASQFFSLIAGAGFHASIFTATAVGFLNFMIFALFAFMLSTRIHLILAAVLSVIVLSTSSNFSMSMINAVGKTLFKFGQWFDYALLLLPSQKSIGNYAIHFLFDKYWTGMIGEMPPEFFELITNKPTVLIQPLIWLGCVFVLSYLSFFRKEFD